MDYAKIIKIGWTNVSDITRGQGDKACSHGLASAQPVKSYLSQQEKNYPVTGTHS